jgi:hypothetical protein
MGQYYSWYLRSTCPQPASSFLFQETTRIKLLTHPHFNFTFNLKKYGTRERERDGHTLELSSD